GDARHAEPPRRLPHHRGGADVPADVITQVRACEAERPVLARQRAGRVLAQENPFNERGAAPLLHAAKPRGAFSPRSLSLGRALRARRPDEAAHFPRCWEKSARSRRQASLADASSYDGRSSQKKPWSAPG